MTSADDSAFLCALYDSRIAALFMAVAQRVARKKSSSRMCRDRPLTLEPERKVGSAVTEQAIRLKRFCTKLPTDH